MQSLFLADHLFNKITRGDKCGTIRLGNRPIEKGLLKFIADDNPDQTLIVEVTEVRVKDFGGLGLVEARILGHATPAIMKTSLQRIYPGVKDTDAMTIIVFKPA